MEKATNTQRKPHPRKAANIFSIISFAYTWPIFKEGFKKDLMEEEIPECLDENSSEMLGNRLEASWKKQLARTKDPSLLKTIFDVFGTKYILLGLMLFTMEVLVKIPQPLALSQLIKYFTQPGTLTLNEAYLYAGLVVGASCMSVIISHTYMLFLQQIGMKMRVGLCSMIYRKTLMLSKTALGGTTIGQVVNLLSNDVSRCDQSLFHIHVLWILPIEIVIIVCLMYFLVGLEAASGVVFMLLFIPFQMYMGKKTSVLRLNTALKTDQRIRLMNEIISGIQVIKMYTWEKPFAKLIAYARKLEIKHIRGTSYIRGTILSFIIFVSRFAVFITILVYVFAHSSLTAEYVFVVTAFYNILRQTMTQQFPKGVLDLAEMRVSIQRIKTFLMYDEIKYNTKLHNYQLKYMSNDHEKKLDKELLTTIINNSDTTIGSQDDTIAIKLKDASAKWYEENSNDTLTDINMTIYKNQTVAIIGAVGSGKSSILNVILKELPLFSGSISINGIISYANQEPWVFASTIRQNILFGQEMNEERYQEVIKVCCLIDDFKMFPYGDKTLVGERGVTLSGGQRARVNLARAIYKQADIYLLDDPLSAVDTHVSKQLFENCIIRYLKGKCVILVTHQLQFLSKVDCIFVLENGTLRLSGSYTDLKKSSTDFTKQLEEAQQEEEKESKIKKKESIADKENDTKEQSEVKEHRSTGKIVSDVYLSYCRAGGPYCIAFCVVGLMILTQTLASCTDYFLTFWVNLEQKKTIEGDSEEFLSRETCVYIYSSIISVMIVITFVRSFSFYTYCMRASTNLHNNMFRSIIKAPMLFFNTNSSGRILNRFSKDIGTVDEILPMVSIDFMQISLHVIGVSTVIALVNPWLLIVTMAILIIFYLMRVVYVRTNRSLKRLEGITKSPVFGHINASLQGVSTIRAFSAQTILTEEFDKHQDLHSSVYFSFIVCSRAFAVYLDLICVIYIGLVTFSFFVIKSETYGGSVGLAITQAISLTGMFQWGMRQWAELETQMTAVERVIEYTRITPEHDPQEILPPEEWPQKGQITFLSLSLKYSTTDVYVLKNLNFDIKPSEKIGIVGRTGAGKSSLIYAIFQLTPTEGEILIDGINTSKIPLQRLRSSISIIPQEPVLFSGTMRKNLDPFDEYPDTDLWSALEEVELKAVIASLPLGLNDRVTEGGSNFSVGQRQLICLARAIIRRNIILVLDEATANVDQHTDQLIQNTIRRKFQDCTVLTIAHRLNTVMDSDKILVMKGGEAIEFDHPYILLKDKNTVLYSMVQQTGSSMSEELIGVAKESFLNKTTLSS